MSRAAVTRLAVLALVAGVAAAVVKALRGPSTSVFDTPSTTRGLLVPSEPAAPAGPPEPPVGSQLPTTAVAGPTEPAAAGGEPGAGPDETADRADHEEADARPAGDEGTQAGRAEPGGGLDSGEPESPDRGAEGDADAPSPAEKRWAAPIDGQCPPSHPIKAKLRSGIYHLPGMMAYDRARPDRCYANEDDARADGLRRAKR